MNTITKIARSYWSLLLVFSISLMFASCQKALLDDNNLAVPPSDNVNNTNDLMMLALPDHQFKVMSFNVRHDDPSDPQTLAQRQGMIKQIIVDNSPDIVGLQEFSNSPFKTWFLAEMTALGYGRTSLEDFGSPKVIFFKNSRFTLINDDMEELDPGVQDRAQNVSWAILQDIATTAQYFVCNTHWSSISQAFRAQNSQHMETIIQSSNTGNLPEIVFGDFNAAPGASEIESLKTNLGLKDALGDYQGDPTYHKWGLTGTSKIDWLMSDVKMAYHSPQVITTSYNDKWPSDHWPVMATFIPAIFGEPNTDPNGTSQSDKTVFNFADVNGDGKCDKIYWNYTADSGKPAVYLSNGNGTFTYAAKITGAASTLAGTSYNYADVDGDGKADAIVWNATQFSGRTRVFLATSAGNFSTTAVENPENSSATATTIYRFADVNGDGKVDKIRWTSSFESGKTRINLATSAGNFNGSTVIDPVGPSTTAGTSFYYADVNNDNKADKMVWHPSLNSGKVMVYLSNGDGTFTASSSFSNSGAVGLASTTQFYFADLNGDGRAEKIYWNPANFLGKLKVYYATTANTFEGTPVYTLRGISESTDTRFYFFDINGDAGGKADQIRWNYLQNSGELRNYLSN
ncbi:FG-GAP-like repeat-containing protein [Pedobacter heparinus]|uniref:FG-GAP-like repeat-containing protein n=1 Tax=Pedobacter heparinus TaxID=984 RepID=UPI0029308FEC|nr:FG-GAP-like repeat-containing protein [Pedobacter heparinus]